MANPRFDVDPPLFIEPVEGWRAWVLDRVDGRLRLRSLTRTDHWPARDAMVATCFAHRAWTVPDERCTCGLYATSSPEQLARSGMLGADISVVGTIAMWGRVIEHTLGARSRFAYPSRLRLVCGPCLALGAGAVTPVRVLGEHGSLKSVCRRHWNEPSVRAEQASDIEGELLATYGVELLPIEQLTGGLRIRPATTRRIPVPADTPRDISRRWGWQIAIGAWFLSRVISMVAEPTSDASAAQADVASSPPALVSTLGAATSNDAPETVRARPTGTSSTTLRWVGDPPTSTTSWPRWLGPSPQHTHE
jgi:hypothetical protein